MKPSLRMRLFVTVVSVVLLLLILFSAGIYAVIRSELLGQFDASLLSVAHILAASVEQDGDEIDIELAVQQAPELQKSDKLTYYQLWRSDGSVVAKSPLLEKRDLPRLVGSLDKPAFGTIRGTSGRNERVTGFSFMPRLADSENKTTKGQPLFLSVARDSTIILNQLRFLRAVLLVASAAVTVISVFVTVLAVNRGLRPLSIVAAEIASIKENDLTARIGTEIVPAELLPVAHRLNELLSRLEAAFNRERRFTADAAHELRTPLAAMRSTIEVTLMRIRDTAEYQSALSECLNIAGNMQAMVNNLLNLARLDANQVTVCKKEIRIGEMVNSCWRQFSRMALTRNISFENRIDEAVSIYSDPQYISIVLSNVLSNAAEYANSGGRIWVAASRSDDALEVAISNTGCILSSADILQVFDPLWRRDPSRSKTNVHCGLGLTIVRRVMQILGGSASAEISDGGVFLVRLVLPDAAYTP